MCWLRGSARMPRTYFQDLREHEISSVERGEESCRSAARRFGLSDSSAIKWVWRFRQLSDRRCAGTGRHRPSKLKPERTWLLAVIEAQPDITLAGLSLRLWAERGVLSDTGMLSRFFPVREHRLQKTCCPPSRSCLTLPPNAPAGDGITEKVTALAWCSSMRHGPRRT